MCICMYVLRILYHKNLVFWLFWCSNHMIFIIWLTTHVKWLCLFWRSLSYDVYHMSSSFLFSFFFLDSLGGLLFLQQKGGRTNTVSTHAVPTLPSTLLSTTESEARQQRGWNSHSIWFRLFTKLSSRENPNYLQVNNLIFSLKSIFVEFDIIY